MSFNNFLSLIQPKQTTQTSILLTTKANTVETWKLILQGRIVAEGFQS
jgi:hypothetical protein